MQLGSLRSEMGNCVTLSIGFTFPIAELDDSLSLVQDGKDYSMTLVYEFPTHKCRKLTFFTILQLHML